ncbi:PLP-dependent transferase [Bradyrhizobium sp. 168]|uniref:PLP-dependent transferase n=1 Tax=Bradyrhizobium sp. 168 TaxID=2782639 RepID=UPI001FF78661|nr:PLP-dependent transferase [Bradyrhizobium sp. 168]MCK1578026.1 PLP-dependent transferase [Bradyrhizobium sp. 168]
MSLDSDCVGASQDGPAKGQLLRDLGVEPIINCTGVRTSYGGCNPTRSVLAAMEASARGFLVMNELAEAVGEKLAALTGAEWGLVTAGSAAAVSQAVAACVAGNDPEKMLKLPLRGEKMVVVAADQRMAYEHALRAVGCLVVPISRASDLDQLPIEKIAAICLIASDIPKSVLPFDRIVLRSKQLRIPLIVDAARQAPMFPNDWLQNGADLLIHSGGKYIRGPQSTGFLLGSERLCRAAYLNGPPGQSFGRSMKVGKDEIIGAYVALEQWVRGGAGRAMERWRDCIAIMKREFLSVPGLSVEEIEPDSAFCNPRIAVSWRAKSFPVSADVIAKKLAGGRPRIVLHDCWQGPQRIVVDPTNLTKVEAEIVGRSIVHAISEPFVPPAAPSQEDFEDLAGAWQVFIDFLHGRTVHAFVLLQEGQNVMGKHIGADVSSNCRGQVVGPKLKLVSQLPGEPLALDYEFEGTLCDGILTGVVYLGASAAKYSGLTFRRQFGQASWRARRTRINATDPVRANHTDGLKCAGRP